MLYSSTLWLHLWLRWAVLIAGLVAWFRAIGGYTARRPWSPKDDLWGMVLSISLDIQVLVGLVLYIFLSPITKIGFQDLSSAMRIDTTRFFTVEHITGMIIAIALVHIGRARIRKAVEPAAKHRTAMIFFGIAMVAIIISIPWPGMPVARPLFRP